MESDEADATGESDVPEASSEYPTPAPAPQPSPAADAFSWRSFWACAGPGWLVSAAYLDPRALEFDLQSGAYSRYELLYVALLRALAGCGFQVFPAQLGALSARGLAQFCRQEYPRGVTLALWATVMLAIAAFSARQLIGAATALHALVDSPLTLGCALAGASALALLAIVSDNAGVNALPPVSQPTNAGFQGGKLMALLFMALLTAMTVCFVSVFSLSAPSVDGLAKALLYPKLRAENVWPSLSMLSAIVVPHNLFLHSALVAKRAHGRSSLFKRALSRYATLEVALALLVGFFVNAAVLAAFAGSVYSSQCAQLSTDQVSAIYGTGIRTACVQVAAARASGHRIYDARTGNTCLFTAIHVFEGDDAAVFTTQAAAACTLCYVDSRDVFSPEAAATPSISAGYCQEIGLTDAAGAVGGALGGAGERLWAIGMLASGVASAMAGAYTAQLVTEAFLLSSRAQGRTWKARTGLTRSLALLPAVAIAIAIVHNSHDLRELGSEVHEASEKWLALLDVVQSAQLPLVLAPLTAFVVRTRGDGGPVSTVVLWVLTTGGALLCALNYGVAYMFLKQALPDPLSKAEWVIGLLIATGYASLLFYLAVVRPSTEVVKKWRPVRDAADSLEAVGVDQEDQEDQEEAIPSEEAALLTPEP